MLIATPYRDFDVRDKSPPKIISEVRKSYLTSAANNLRPKLSGDLPIRCGIDKTWHQRRLQVRSGQLHVYGGGGDGGPPPLRIPLRHLSLQAGPLPYSLAICRGQNIVLTIQTANEKSFDLWVKTLAIELIRQTPLDAIKYLDILTLAECWTRQTTHCEKDWNFNNISPTKEPPCITCENAAQERSIGAHAAGGATISQVTSPKPEPTSHDTEEVVETLLKKCQNVETYVPVKEKLFLFESLCKMGRKVRSSEDVSFKIDKTTTKRAKSCHDLSNINTHIAVREICKYFEHKGEEDGVKTPTKINPGRGWRIFKNENSLTA